MTDQILALMHGMGHTLLQLGVWLAIAMAVMIPLEHWRALRPQAVLRPRFLQDILYFFVSGVVPAFFLLVVYAVVVRFFQALLPRGWFVWVQSLPGGVRLVATLLAADFGFYWAHRWAHEWPAIWRFHAIHHSPTQIDWLVATRTHPFEIVWLRGLSFVPLFALGLIDPFAPGQSTGIMLVVIFNVMWGFFIHGNVSIRLRWLEKIVATPRFHHWHHANDGESTHGKNYAALLPFLDRLFGTAHLPGDDYPDQYGCTTKVPDHFLAQLALRPALRPAVAAAGAEEATLLQR